MIRFYFPIIALGAIGTLVACSARDPVVDEANNAGTAEVSVPPSDESATGSTNELGSRADEPSTSTAIPASLHGRWGMTPDDCTSTRGDAKGLLTVSADQLKFYESVAKPAGELKISGNSASGEFTFTGEGMNWKKFQALELQDNKLVRTESDPIASYAYVRCA